MRYLIFSSFLFISLSLFSQSDIQTLNAIAKQAKNNGEFEKAISYYEDLYKKNSSIIFYEELLSLYKETQDYRSAEKIIRKRIKAFPNQTEYLVDYGSILELQDQPKEANKYYKKAIDQFDGSSQKAKGLAQKFNNNRLYEYSEEVYLKTQKINRNDQLFQLDLANNYMQQGETDKMIDQYLSIIGRNPSYIQYVQNIFSRVLNPDPEGKAMESIKTQVIKKVQENPNNLTYSEFLIWLYLQEENYTGALIQAKALDKKHNEGGRRVYKLGQLSLSNKNYSVSEEAFSYVISIGDKSPFYLKSKLELINVKRERTFENNDYSREDLLALKSSYISLLSDFGRNAYTIDVVKDLAYLESYYLDSIKNGIMILEDALEYNSLSMTEKAEIKLDLGDLLLLSGEIWDASLLYSQVDKDFKFDELGERAKFRNAKVAFYVGDFYWAQAQLDVLKGSTSKLISNDAMDLSLLITDNIGLDSIPEPLEMYARADLLQMRKSYDNCIKTLDSIPKFFPASSLKDEILMKKYQISFDQKEYHEAASYLEELISSYAEDILGDDALFYLANLNENYLGQKEKAQEQYKQLISAYPGSLFVVESRKRFRNLRGDNPL